MAEPGLGLGIHVTVHFKGDCIYIHTLLARGQSAQGLWSCDRDSISLRTWACRECPVEPGCRGTLCGLEGYLYLCGDKGRVSIRKGLCHGGQLVRLCIQVAEVAMTVIRGSSLWHLSSEFIALSKALRKSPVEEVTHLVECLPTRHKTLRRSS